MHTDHESLRYLKTWPQPPTPRQARWSQFLEEYNLTLWYVPGLENPAADACSRLTSQQLMDIDNATRTRAFVIPLIKNWASPEGEPVDEFLHVLEDSFSHNEVWPQPYDHLYVSLRSGRSVGKEPDADEHAEPALQFDTEPAVEREDLEPLPSGATTVEPEDLGQEPVPSNEIMAEDSHQPDMHLDDAGNEPDRPADTNNLPDVSMDRPLRVTFGNGVSLLRVFDTAGYGRIRQDMAGYGRIRQDTAGYGRIRQDTAGYGRVRQIRQDTAGYGRIRQDTTGSKISACLHYENNHSAFIQRSVVFHNVLACLW